MPDKCPRKSLVREVWLAFKVSYSNPIRAARLNNKFNCDKNDTKSWSWLPRRESNPPLSESQSTYTKPNLEAAVRQPLVRMREFRNIRNPENKNTRQEWREGGKEKIKN
jgi:hypothetical protein